MIFLFTDGEERGLIGARAFVDQHRWARDVGVVLNLDTRGNTGPALLLATNDDGGWVVDEFAKAAPTRWRPRTASHSSNDQAACPTSACSSTLAGRAFGLLHRGDIALPRCHGQRELDERSLQHLRSVHPCPHPALRLGQP